jgi:putative phosphoesterase
MKIGVLSDTHLQKIDTKIIEVFEHYFRDVDLILHAGDFITGDLLTYFNQKAFQGVQGNMDHPDVKAALPIKRVIQVDPFRLGLIHGWGAPHQLEDRISPEFDDVDVIVYGHSHRAANHVQDGVLFFNPGTACGYTSSGTHSIGMLHIGEQIQGEIIQI